jgi:hypothetical protein
MAYDDNMADSLRPVVEDSVVTGIESIARCRSKAT